ncbi:substrate-binding domain-containing protein [Treponema sp.]|uniref:substrate-binding domain-containing protein n=1 Tax=Treponema sp. TaxID=166 RepID=UPI00388DE322
MKKSLFFIAAIFFSAFLNSCFLFPLNESEGKILNIGFAYSGKVSEPYLSNYYTLKSAFEDTSRYNFIEYSADCDLKEQTNQIYKLVQRKVDYLIIDPVNEHGLDYAIDNCFQQNIPVVLYGSSVTFAPGNENKAIFEVRTDFYKEASLATKCLEIYEKGKVDVEICVLNDFSDSTSARERGKAISEAMEKNEGWKLISKRETGGDYLTAKEYMEEIYLSCPGIDAVFVESENDYQGVIDVLFKHGKMPGEDVLVFAFEDSDNLRKMILSGVLNFTVINNQDAGEEVRNVVSRISKGRSYGRKTVFDASGVYSNKSIEEKILSKEKNFFSRIFD